MVSREVASGVLIDPLTGQPMPRPEKASENVPSPRQTSETTVETATATPPEEQKQSRGAIALRTTAFIAACTIAVASAAPHLKRAANDLTDLATDHFNSLPFTDSTMDPGTMMAQQFETARTQGPSTDTEKVVINGSEIPPVANPHEMRNELYALAIDHGLLSELSDGDRRSKMTQVAMIRCAELAYQGDRYEPEVWLWPDKSLGTVVCDIRRGTGPE